MKKIDTFEINGVTYELEDSNAVQREPGKDLITDEEREKLAGIAAGAQVNVQPDWDESDTDSDAFIRNKPDLSGYATTGALSALSDGLLSGSIVPRLAEDLVSWDDESLMTDDTQTVSVATTGGDLSIKSSVPAQLTEIAARTDFSASALVATGFNLLRLRSAAGIATAIGGGFYFPVPALPFGRVNTAEQPNGILFTGTDGANLRPTVYFKRMSAGVPTGVTDGMVCDHTDASTGGKEYRFYTTEEPGYMIVSGITWAETCAHVGWSKRYDEFIAPDDPSDAGHALSLAPVISAMHPYEKMLAVGGSADRITRVSATQVRWETECDKVKPTWTTTLQEDGETYLHTATIPGMKADGAARFETLSQQLTVSGTTVSYTDGSESAPTDFVEYEKAASASGVASLDTSLDVEDWGLIALLDASGEAYTTIAYAQGIPDNVRALVSARLSGQMGIVAQAFAELYGEVSSLKEALQGGGGIHRLSAPSFDSGEYRSNGIPMVVEGAGAPSSSVVPKDWERLCPGVVWTGIPLTPGMMYLDNAGNKWYKAKMTLTGAVADWVLLN